MQTKMRALLQSENYGDLRRACIAQMYKPDGVKFSENLVKDISSTQNIDDLFDFLRSLHTLICQLAHVQSSCAEKNQGIQ